MFYLLARREIEIAFIAFFDGVTVRTSNSFSGIYGFTSPKNDYRRLDEKRLIYSKVFSSSKLYQKLNVY